VWQRLASPWWEAKLKGLIAEHALATDSKWAHSILDDWDRWRSHFWQVCPREMLTRLDKPLTDDAAQLVAAE
jgi:glutamate synthase (NADPH/NADH) large chain